MTEIDRNMMKSTSDAVYRVTLTAPSRPDAVSPEFHTIETACEWAIQQPDSNHYTIQDLTGSTVATGMLVKGVDETPVWNWWRINQ